MKRPIAYIAGTGRGVPAKVMTNHDFAALGHRDDRTSGSSSAPASRERHIAAAGRDDLLDGRRRRRAARCSGPACSAGEIDAIVLSTATPDRLLPVDRRRSAGGARRHARRGVRHLAPRARAGIYGIDGRRRADRRRRRRDGARRRRREDERHRRLDRIARRACCSATAPARRCSSARRAAHAASSRTLHAQRRHARRSALTVPPAARRRPFSRRRARRPLAFREDGGPRGVQARRALDGRSLRPRARRARSSPATTSTC